MLVYKYVTNIKRKKRSNREGWNEVQSLNLQFQSLGGLYKWKEKEKNNKILTAQKVWPNW